jgi:hypothetical protein
MLLPAANSWPNNESMAQILISFREVLDRALERLRGETDPRDEELHEGNTDLTDEDVKRVFSAIVLSYMGNYTDPPRTVLRDMMEHADLRYDYFEGRNAEMALAMIDEISQVASRFFPFLKQRERFNSIFSVGDLVKHLEVADARMFGRDCVIILVPIRVLEKLKHENHSTGQNSSGGAAA